MGRTKGLYNCEFPPGTLVRIAERTFLEQFKRDWRLHHKLAAEQLDYGGRTARVRRVSVYHGGDELYELEEIPGIWHEVCLTAASGEEIT